MDYKQFQKKEADLRAKHAKELAELENARKEMLLEKYIAQEIEVNRLAGNFEIEWIDNEWIQKVHKYLVKQVFDVIEQADRNDDGRHNVHELHDVAPEELAIMFALVARAFAKESDQHKPGWREE